ncbi:M14 family metallopeptidase [Maribacter sp. CXY002]|uniref:M14 family metallopeptidase n=1 Tax=Maribacter luteocoastalis TaxID=3407671 RepID=UPI003B66DFA1
MILEDFDYANFKVNDVQGRYVTNQHILPFLKQLDSSFNLEVIGTSVNQNPIYGLTVGSGPIKILMWSQMHGNESTTTKAVLDLLHFFELENDNGTEILSSCTLKIIPILNPDGAEAYTRINANEIDLNRDAQKRTQPESRVLKYIYDEFKPDYCFNLHDQRTIFNVGNTDKPATISFLAPAFDEDRNNSESRELSMLLIAAMNSKLQTIIKGQVGRYDDSFNSNCVGDAFQMRQTPTILFEAGHFPEDYAREKTRELIFLALTEVIIRIINNSANDFSIEDYLSIPENNKMFFDVLIKNAHMIDSSLEHNSNIGVLFKEVLKMGEIVFSPTLEKQGLSINEYFGHKTLDCSVESDMEWMAQNGILKLF